MTLLHSEQLQSMAQVQVPAQGLSLARYAFSSLQRTVQFLVYPHCLSRVVMISFCSTSIRCLRRSWTSPTGETPLWRSLIGHSRLRRLPPTLHCPFDGLCTIYWIIQLYYVSGQNLDSGFSKVARSTRKVDWRKRGWTHFGRLIT